MKIIHCSDLHLDSKMETNLTREQAAERKQELLKAFFNMVDYAKEKDVKVIIIAGDMFDTPMLEQKRIKTRVSECIKATPDTDFIYLRGNHDRDGFLTQNAKEYVNLKTFSDKWEYYRYGNVVISGCELAGDNLTGIYDSLILREEDINIAVMHGNIMESGTPGEDDILLGKLRNKNIDYLALGHIHKYSGDRLDNRGIYRYSGCLESRGFDECGEKGFVVLDIDENARVITPEFVGSSIRQCKCIEVKLTGEPCEREIIDSISDAVRDIPPRDLVRVVLTGEISENTDIDLTYILKNFEQNFYFFKIYNHTRLMINYGEYRNTVSLKGEFIRRVEQSNLDEDTKNKVILTGIRALTGREISY